MSGIYFHPIRRVFLNLSGGTVSGDTVFTQGLSADSFSISTLPSTDNSIDDILVRRSDGTVVVRDASSLFNSGATIQDLQSVVGVGSTASTTDDVFIETTGGAQIEYKSDTASIIVGNVISASTISMGGDIEAQQDNTYDIGSPVRRFRNLNTVNGVAVNFTASTKVKTQKIELGNTEVTEDNIILTGNTIDGGSW